MLARTADRIAAGLPLRLVAYGDSISEVGRTPSWHGGASAPQHNWAAVLGRRIAEAWTCRVEATHFGIGGQNTYEGLGRLDSLWPLEPDLVVIAFGANDCCYHFLEPEESRLALDSLARAVAAAGIDVVIAGTGGDNPQRPTFRHLDANLAAQRQAAGAADVPYADIRRAILAATADGRDWAAFHLGPDNCHPNDRGHRVWADTVAAAILAAQTA